MYCRSYMYVIVIKRTFIFVCTCTMWWRQRGWSKLCVTFISSVLNTTTYSWACSDKCNFWRIVSGILLPIFDEHSLTLTTVVRPRILYNRSPVSFWYTYMYSGLNYRYDLSVFEWHCPHMSYNCWWFTDGGRSEYGHVQTMTRNIQTKRSGSSFQNAYKIAFH